MFEKQHENFISAVRKARSGKQEETSMVKMSGRKEKRAGTQAKSYTKMLEMFRTLFCVILLVYRMRF